MKVTAALRVNSRTNEVKAQGNGFAEDFVGILADETVRLARANVLPGIGREGFGGAGPGPHPHRTKHYDTGKLRDSIVAQVRRQGFIVEARVETDLEYGLFLEMGWTTVAGTHYRYPWLYPAAVEASRRWQPIARSSADRWFTDGGRPMRIHSPLSATWQAE